MNIYLIATLDTKGPEAQLLRDLLRSRGADVTVVDVGCLGEPAFRPEVPRTTVYQAAGADVAAVGAAGDRGAAIEIAADGAAQVVQAAHEKGEVDGVIALGGSAGTTIGTAAMRTLPLATPKVMVSTLASGQVRPWVGDSNIFMLNSVVDIAGVNRISRLILRQAAGAVLGATDAPQSKSADNEDRPLIAATMFGVTTPCVQQARAILEDAGYEVLIFHATGNGGQAMEALIRAGMICGVLDVTTTELADELVGGILSAGPDRLTAAAELGVPQVVSVGALDMVNFGPRDSVPERFADRTLYQHNPTVTLMRTTVDECRQLGEQIGRKVSASKGPAAILLPAAGISAIDADDQPFEDSAARRTLFDAVREHADDVDVDELPLHINDPSFAEAAARKLLAMLPSPAPS